MSTQPLPNVRWERFCQNVAAGLPGAESYRLAGFSSTTAGNGAYLLRKRHPEVNERIAALTAAIADQAATTVAERAAALTVEVKVEAEVQNRVRVLQVEQQPTREWVLSELAQNIEVAKERGDRSSINRALELIGKELGMFVDRKMEIRSPLDGLSADQLVALLAVAERLQGGVQIAAAAIPGGAPPSPAAPALPPAVTVIDAPGEPVAPEPPP